ncbi:MAG: hypothetical protein QNJ73_13080 [Gammaproteobacteria bacterium]|nr:hypothetical protein [Gammaproteobacteria bacterium]
MRKLNEKLVGRIVLKAGFLLVVGAGLVGCGGPSSSDGVVANEIPLPTDTLLNLACADVGINIEQCVLDDFENPFRATVTKEFDPNDPDADTKFALNNSLPEGPTGAKARFYLWATALARFPSGENQYNTALALHELFTTSGDPLIREQAKRAYRSVWENFFGSVTVFECCGEFFPEPRDDTAFAVPLNELVLERLVRAAEFTSMSYPNGFEPLIPDDPSGLDAGLIELETQEVITSWGFNYRCTGLGAARTCFVEVSVFP